MIFGIHAIVEALEANKEIDKVIIKRDLASDLSVRLFEALKSHPMVQVQRVPVQKLDSYTRKNHEGAIAFISKVEYQKLSGVVPACTEAAGAAGAAGAGAAAGAVATGAAAGAGAA